MTSRDFCFWLQGYFELASNQEEGFSDAQMGMIRQHLHLVFKHDIAPQSPSQMPRTGFTPTTASTLETFIC